MPHAPQVFHVQPEQAGRTLADALRGWLPELSWSQIQRLVRGRQVQIDGNLCSDAGRRLKGREVVRLLPQAAAPAPSAAAVRIRYLDAHLVVVEKPAGITSVRHAEERDWPARRKQIQPTLDELLPPLIAEQEGRGRKSPGKPPGRPAKAPSRAGGGNGHHKPVRAVHRLDRETSGLMVFARTPLAAEHLEQQFRQHTTHRRYLAVAAGRVEPQRLESRLVRDRGDGRRGSTALPKVGKAAVTHVRVVERLSGYTLVECQLETGRTHQIRIHLSEAGHPLCGDKEYRQPLGKQPLPDRSGAPRVALHAAELGLTHPVTGEELRFTMPLPADLLKFLDRLRQSDAVW